MKGYDSLIGSHYDKYVIQYKDFSREKLDPSGNLSTDLRVDFFMQRDKKFANFFSSFQQFF